MWTPDLPPGRPPWTPPACDAAQGRFRGSDASPRHPADEPQRLARVAVVGPSGAGKTTVARALHERLELPHLELDAAFHGPGWTPTPTAALRAHVATAVAEDRWVTDGHYVVVRDLIWPRATTLVWLDLPRALTTARVARRTLRRVLTRAELWNGNREVWHEALRLWDRERSPIASAWSIHGRKRDEVREHLARPEHAHLHVVRLRSPAEVARWLAELPVSPGGGDGPRSRGRAG